VGVIARSGERQVQAFGRVIAATGSRPARAEDRFVLTSVSKGVTALQAVSLADAGRLDLAAPIGERLAEYAVNGKHDATIEHVLSHSSGLSAAANTAEGPLAGLSAEQHLERAIGADLSFAPGSGFEYSSPGFWVVAELITRCAGVDYKEDLRARVAGPLGLTDLRYEAGVQEPERYVWRDPPVEFPHHELARLRGYPSGGIVASVSDLLGLAGALIAAAGGETRGAITPGVVAEVGRRRSRGQWQGETVDWGLGWEIGGPGTLRPQDTLFCAGAAGTAVWVDAVGGVALVLLTASWDSERAGFAELADAAWGGLLG
jgi:CubicO group peptidase (beta-lactamase class C family)